MSDYPDIFDSLIVIAVLATLNAVLVYFFF